MARPITQIKFTLDSDIVSAFKARCKYKGVSMASVISHFMKTGLPDKDTKKKTETRLQRRKTVLELIGLLNIIKQMEEKYRDNIPEQFESRYEVSNYSCEQLEEAISYLEDSY